MKPSTKLLLVLQIGLLLWPSKSHATKIPVEDYGRVLFPFSIVHQLTPEEFCVIVIASEHLKLRLKVSGKTFDNLCLYKMEEGHE